jgi:uncharacterized protein (TIGR02271 family)
MLTKEHIDDLLNRDGNVLSTDGDKIGSIGQIYADDDNGQPTWVTARTGLFGTSESFIPLEGARIEGSDIVVPYSKDQVKDAPRVDTDGHLDPSEEDRLYEHYQLNGAVTYSDATAGQNTGAAYGETSYSATERDAGFAATRRDGTYNTADASDTVGRDTSGPTTDDAMTRSEERMKVGVERHESGHARLRKYVVTEEVEQVVPVRREEVRVEREPITEANRDAALSGEPISEAEYEVTLHEERPVVETETVPVERVRMTTDEQVDQETVHGQVRKERIDTETDEDEGGKRRRK